MEIIKKDQIKAKENKRGVQFRTLLKNDNVQVNNLILKPGDSVPPHSVPVDVFFYIVRGKGTLHIGEDEAVVSATDIITCPPGTKMSLIADQGEEFEVLNVKTPSL
ncbi:MAG: cupin domain-containing protein [Elusimicrobiota bacterium]